MPHSGSASSLKILVGLMLAEEKNCYRILGLLGVLMLILFGFWWLPGFGLIWRFITMGQTVAQYKLGFLGNSAVNAGLSSDSLDRVFENLKQAWQRAIHS